MQQPAELAALLASLGRLGISESRVLHAMEQVPRHVFVDPALRHRAYQNVSLPIGFGQTISQPWVVARMTELLLQQRPSLGRTLEVGTGCGYQTAVLAGLSDALFTIERLTAFRMETRRRFQQLDLHAIQQRSGDGFAGWPDQAPFDSILIAAACDQVPAPLLAQLAPQGRLVLPLKHQDQQRLCRIEYTGHAEHPYRKQWFEPVQFVPFIRHGEPSSGNG